MLRLFRVTLSVTASAAFAAIVVGQAPDPLKPRELFYRPVVAAGTQPKATQAPVAKPEDVAEAKPAAKPPKKAGKNVPKQPASGESPKAATQRPGRSPLETRSEVPVVNAALSTTEFPLALKYSLERRSASGKYVSASPDAVFHSGDGIRLKVEANDAGYLYLVHQGTSKVWRVLLPDPKIDSGRNNIGAHVEVIVPRDGSFRFEEPAGDDKIFVVFSRKPQNDVEAMIQAVKSLGKPAKPPAAPVQMAQARLQLPDELIEGLRLRSRDLVYEKDTGEEKAVYVATPNRSTEAQVVTLITLKHQ